jgi:hypothetical protein
MTTVSGQIVASTMKELAEIDREEEQKMAVRNQLFQEGGDQVRVQLLGNTCNTD